MALHAVQMSAFRLASIPVSPKDYSWEAYGGYLAEEGSVIDEVA